MRRASGICGAAIAICLAGAPPAAAQLPQGDEPVQLDPATFSTRIDNPYWPMRPGTRWIYRETAPDGSRQKVVVRVTQRTRLIANGITARVVRDTVTERGRLVEDTRDWYAQDAAGTIWYLGERTTEYEHGKPASTEGSFEAGVDGAQPGVVMPAHPAPGMTYRQEHYAGHAEDHASILRLGEQVLVAAGHFDHVLLTREVNPLEPRALEYKLFARGVGPVLALEISGGNGREELVRIRRPRSS
jgi:hypothetical protein